jgi:hypothetical protein
MADSMSESFHLRGLSMMSVEVGTTKRRMTIVMTLVSNL